MYIVFNWGFRYLRGVSWVYIDFRGRVMRFLFFSFYGESFFIVVVCVGRGFWIIVLGLL